MAASKLVRLQLIFCYLSFAAAADVECSIKLLRLNHTANPHYHLVKEYPCTPQSFGVTAVSYSWAKCPFTDTDPASACGPLDPAPFDNRSHVAVVPCAYSNCSLEEKANNLGQANYVAFITWNDNNCSNNFDLLTVASTNLTAVAIIVNENDGRELLSLANNPIYVVDVYINYFPPWLIAVVVVVLVLLCCVTVFLPLLCCICGCICGMFCACCESDGQDYGISSKVVERMAVKCTYKIGRGMNETCSICLEDFTEGEKVRELPCLHVYHGGCVEKWLKEYKHTCPLCKTPITARRKKRVAAVKSDRTPLLAAAEVDASVNYGALSEEAEDRVGSLVA